MVAWMSDTNYSSYTISHCITNNYTSDINYIRPILTILSSQCI